MSAAARDPIDTATLDRYRVEFGSDADDLIREINEGFLLQAPEQARAIQAALNDLDALEISAAAHGLKGNAQGIGALDLHDLCLELEQRTRVGDLTDAPLLCAAVASELQRVVSALRR